MGWDDVRTLHLIKPKVEFWSDAILSTCIIVYARLVWSLMSQSWHTGRWCHGVSRAGCVEHASLKCHVLILNQVKLNARLSYLARSSCRHSWLSVNHLTRSLWWFTLSNAFENFKTQTSDSIPSSRLYVMPRMWCWLWVHSVRYHSHLWPWAHAGCRRICC